MLKRFFSKGCFGIHPFQQPLYTGYIPVYWKKNIRIENDSVMSTIEKILIVDVYYESETEYIFKIIDVLVLNQTTGFYASDKNCNIIYTNTIYNLFDHRSCRTEILKKAKYLYVNYTYTKSKQKICIISDPEVVKSRKFRHYGNYCYHDMKILYSHRTIDNKLIDSFNLPLYNFRVPVSNLIYSGWFDNYFVKICSDDEYCYNGSLITIYNKNSLSIKCKCHEVHMWFVYFIDERIVGIYVWNNAYWGISDKIDKDLYLYEWLLENKDKFPVGKKIYFQQYTSDGGGGRGDLLLKKGYYDENLIFNGMVYALKTKMMGFYENGILNTQSPIPRTSREPKLKFPLQKFVIANPPPVITTNNKSNIKKNNKSNIKKNNKSNIKKNNKSNIKKNNKSNIKKNNKSNIKKNYNETAWKKWCKENRKTYELRSNQHFYIIDGPRRGGFEEGKLVYNSFDYRPKGSDEIPRYVRIGIGTGRK
jgi:hypothetical protein